MQEQVTVDSTETNKTQVNVNATNDEETTVVEPTEEDSSSKQFDRLKSDLFKWKEKARQAEQALKAKDEGDLKKRQEWQTLAEIKEEEARIAKEESDHLRKAIIMEKKLVAIKEACLPLGIDKNAMSDIELLNLDDLEIETTSTGRINVLDADKYAQRLKVIKPHWFTTKKGGGVHADNPEVVTGSDVTYDEVITAGKTAEKTGDYAPYEKLLMKYKKQLQLRR